MIVKMFAGGGSAKNSADYLIGKKHDREEARELRGDIRLTQAIAEQANYSQQVTVGCLSFEEKNIPENQKIELMDKFEDTFFAGLEKEDYSIAWIEHTDKGRLELNFYIANVELSSNKRLKPYFHKADFHLKDSFQKVVNQEYGFSKPEDPEKRQLLRQNKTLNKTAKEIQNETHNFIKNEIETGNITSREEVIDLLDKAYGISRVTPEAISFKNPNGGRNIRLRGEFYSERFYKENGDGLSKDITESERETTRRDNSTSGRNNEEELARYQRAIEIRKERNIKEYKKHISRSKAGLELNDGHSERESGTAFFTNERESINNKKTDLQKVDHERNNRDSFSSPDSNSGFLDLDRDTNNKEAFEGKRRDSKPRIVITEFEQGLSEQANRLSKYKSSRKEPYYNERGIEEKSISSREQRGLSTVIDSQKSKSADDGHQQINTNQNTDGEERLSYEIIREVERADKVRAKRVEENKRRAFEIRERIEQFKEYASGVLERIGFSESINTGVSRIKDTIESIKQNIDDYRRRKSGSDLKTDGIKSGIVEIKSSFEHRERALSKIDNGKPDQREKERLFIERNERAIKEFKEQTLTQEKDNLWEMDR